MSEQEPRPTPLLPCPFCGGEPWISEDDHGNPRWACCEICACDGPTATNAGCDGMEEVVAAWNQRVPQPHALTHEQVERARAMITRLGKCLPATCASQVAIDQVIDLLREVVCDATETNFQNKDT